MYFGTVGTHGISPFLINERRPPPNSLLGCWIVSNSWVLADPGGRYNQNESLLCDPAHTPLRSLLRSRGLTHARCSPSNIQIVASIREASPRRRLGFTVRFHAHAHFWCHGELGIGRLVRPGARRGRHPDAALLFQQYSLSALYSLRQRIRLNPSLPCAGIHRKLPCPMSIVPSTLPRSRTTTVITDQLSPSRMLEPTC